MVQTAETRDGLLLALRNWNRQRKAGKLDRDFLFRLQKAVNNDVVEDQDPAFGDAWARLSEVPKKTTRRPKKLEYRQEAVTVNMGKKTARLENPACRLPQTLQNTARRSTQNLEDGPRHDDRDLRKPARSLQGLKNTARRSPQRLEYATRPDIVTKDHNLMRQGTADLRAAENATKDDEGYNDAVYEDVEGNEDEDEGSSG